MSWFRRDGTVFERHCFCAAWLTAVGCPKTFSDQICEQRVEQVAFNRFFMIIIPTQLPIPSGACSGLRRDNLSLHLRLANTELSALFWMADIAPQNMVSQKERIPFQPSLFQVSFREGTSFRRSQVHIFASTFAVYDRTRINDLVTQCWRFFCFLFFFVFLGDG